VLQAHPIRDVCSYGYSEKELRTLLAEERGIARRQELLKALWKLAQQRREDSSVTASEAKARSANKHKSSAMTSQQTESLSISC
jgi:hypothetical protein